MNGSSQIAHLGRATGGPPAVVAANGEPPVAHPPHQRCAIWVELTLWSLEKMKYICLEFYEDTVLLFHNVCTMSVLKAMSP